MNLEDFPGIIKIQETESVIAANDLLANGWKLLSIRERTKTVVDPYNRPCPQVSPVYVFGWTGPLAGEQQTISEQIEAGAGH